ncbi:MAG: Serine/threonine-protein kinase pkn1 [Pseudomonadota bacterium]
MSVIARWLLPALLMAGCSPTQVLPTTGSFDGAGDESEGKKSKSKTRGASGQVADSANGGDTGNAVALGAVTPPSAVEQLIAQDAVNNSGASIIYATIGHLSPDGQQNEKLAIVRQGMVKVLNSVSSRSEIVNLQAIDPGQTVYRIDMAAYNQVAAINRLKSADQASSNVSTVGNATVVKGDWLVFALSRPEVYDPIMNLPQLGRLLDARLGVDWNQAKYLNVSKSEVAFAGRVLARVPLQMGGKPGGYYWRSYDFVREDVRDRAFRDPSTVRVTTVQDFVAGEFFFSLPNGLQGYFLTGFGDQHRYDVPADRAAGGISPPVASDYRRPQDGLNRCVAGKAPCGIVINGESCMTCHAYGINMPIESAGANNATMAEMHDLINQDRARFVSALKEMGIEEGPVEPILGSVNVFRADRGYADKRRQASEVSGLTGR